MRYLLLLPLLVVGCATPSPQQQSTRSTTPPRASEPWRAVPAKADGIRVDGGRMHIVKRGETGIAIAIAYRVPWGRIAAANRLHRDAILQIGQSLFIPTGEARSARAPAPAPDRAAPTPARRAPAPERRLTPEEYAAAFELDIDDLITGSAVAGEAKRPAATTSSPAPVRRPQTVSSSGVPPLSWPAEGRVILSHFGAKPGGRFNDGINIKTVQGQSVRAAADGEVIYVGDAIAGFGLLILVRHAGGTVTAYGHLEAALAARGERVASGQPIGRAGSSGSVREPQLLFQVRQGRKALDPLLYLPS